MRRAAAAALAAALLAALGLSACRKRRRDAPPPQPRYAVLHTSMGDIELELFSRRAPKTVESFVALSEGKKAWRDPRTGRTRTGALYRDLPIFRVIADELVQTGDPAGTGQGDPGFALPDEFSPGLKYDRPGMVGMANYGPGTGNSQFFIALKPMPDLDGRHTLFAEVVSGLDVARAISRVPRDETDGLDRPFHPPVLRSITFSDR